MPSTTVFQTTSFDPLTKPQGQTIVFDAAGIIDRGPFENAVEHRWDKDWLDAYIETGLYRSGYGWLLFDVDAQFPDATYFVAVVPAVPLNTQIPAEYLDHGIQGTSGNDIVIDKDGNDIINTGAGNDLVMALWGNNAVSTGAGDDSVVVGDGDDIIVTGRGRDMVVSRGGNDTVSLGKGADYIEAGAGDDSVWGDDGADEIHGEDGADVLHGGRGVDRLFGTAGEDWLLGQNGADRLKGGADNDRLTGGGGADTFVFSLGSGADSVTDFRTTADSIEVDTDLGLLSFVDILNAASQEGSDVVIAVGTDSLTLENTDLSDLARSHFDFV